MGLFSWLFRRASPPEHFEPSGDFTFEVVGESFYQDALLRICGGRTERGHKKEVLTTLVQDDANPHDNMAIRVDVNGRTVGHLKSGGGAAVPEVARCEQPRRYDDDLFSSHCRRVG